MKYKLQELKQNQYMISVPAAIVRAKNWKKGQKLSWKINKKGNLELTSTS